MMTTETDTQSQVVNIKLIILCGGSGTRLFPLSTSENPKQFLRLTSDNSLLQETALRFKSDQDHLIICNARHVNTVTSQLAQINVKNQVLIEPYGKNTAPAIYAGALKVAEENPETIMLIVPVDHIFDKQKFNETVQKALPLVEQNRIVTFGIQPEYPETGFGYIKKVIGDHAIDRFVEKPALDVAEKLVADGNYFWNSGVFMAKAKVFLNEFTTHCAPLTASVSINENKIVFADTTPDISVDYAVMEKTKLGSMIVYSGLWSDIGSWYSLHKVLTKDANGNVIINRNNASIRIHNVKNCLILHEGDDTLALVAQENVSVIKTKDTLLICPFDASQDVKKVRG